jgi:hypothetical protein
MDNKQYYSNLSSNEQSIESRKGSKILMDSKGNVLLTTSRRPEYINQLREEYYQGNIALNPDEEGSYFFVGTDQVDINQAGNVNQDSINVQFNDIVSPEFGVSTSLDEPNFIPLPVNKNTLPDDEYSYGDSAWFNGFGDINGDGTGFEGTPSPEDIIEAENIFLSIDSISK